MRVDSTKTFEKHFKKAPGYVKKKIAELYVEMEKAKAWEDVPAIKEMSKPNFYRIRIVDYRLGITIKGNVIELRILLHRKEVYRFFP